MMKIVHHCTVCARFWAVIKYAYYGSTFTLEKVSCILRFKFDELRWMVQQMQAWSWQSDGPVDLEVYSFLTILVWSYKFLLKI
jgi:hypothetical protein